jgi:hypothetical protein
MTNEPQTSPPAQRVLSLEQLTSLIPGLGTLMPEVGQRTWKLYYAAQAQNWPMASFQLNEIRGLLNKGAFTRPRYEEDLKAYIDESLAPIRTTIQNKDFAAFQAAFKDAIDSANSFHRSYDKAYIVWKLPDSPPPDLDLTPQE